MNIKILKKIRKRFNYYKNKENVWVVVDHKTQEAYTVDKERLLSKYPNFKKEDVNEGALFRFLKKIITQELSFDYLSRINYKAGTRRYKKKLTK